MFIHQCCELLRMCTLFWWRFPEICRLTSLSAQVWEDTNQQRRSSLLGCSTSFCLSVSLEDPYFLPFALAHLHSVVVAQLLRLWDTPSATPYISPCFFLREKASSPSFFFFSLIPSFALLINRPVTIPVICPPWRAGISPSVFPKLGSLKAL